MSVVALAAVLILALLLTATVAVNVDYRRRLARMTPEERRAHDEEMSREMQTW